MTRQPFHGAHLIFPRKTARVVRRELYIIRRIGVDEIIRLELDRLNISIAELPAPEDRGIVRKVARVVNCFVGAKRDIEIAGSIEAAKAIKASSVQIVEQLGTFFALRFAVANQAVESVGMAIEEFLIVARGDVHLQ